MMTSMTGFAALRGMGAGYTWAWDIRAVNGKGLDLRLRVPDWIDGLEQGVRAALQASVSRGNINLTLKVARDEAAVGSDAIRINDKALEAVLIALSHVEAAAMNTRVTLAHCTAADVLAMRGVLETATSEEDTTALRSAILSDLPALLQEFNAMRRAEGEVMATVISGQLDRIAALTADAAREVVTRRDSQATGLREALAKVLQATEGVDETRLAQELALIAVKSDVQEELDRLAAHVEAARTLLAEGGSVGRKFDFLMQEFMREANTLCSKAQALSLTRIGLDLKTVIDQLREQVQNVE
jgi:uncharacterized protein (TIGR00255 family)